MQRGCGALSCCGGCIATQPARQLVTTTIGVVETHGRKKKGIPLPLCVFFFVHVFLVGGGAFNIKEKRGRRRKEEEGGRRKVERKRGKKKLRGG